jgi:hypothetical protein
LVIEREKRIERDEEAGCVSGYYFFVAPEKGFFKMKEEDGRSREYIESEGKGVCGWCGA